MHQHIKEWSDSKARISVESLRKIENKTKGTKFEKARGFTRKNWSSKNFNPDDNPLMLDTSSSEDEA